MCCFSLCLTLQHKAKLHSASGLFPAGDGSSSFSWFQQNSICAYNTGFRWLAAGFLHNYAILETWDTTHAHMHTPVVWVHSEDPADMRSGSYWHHQILSEAGRIETVQVAHPCQLALAGFMFGLAVRKKNGKKGKHVKNMTEILADKLCASVLCAGVWLPSLTVKKLHRLSVVCFSVLNFKKPKTKKAHSCCFHQSSQKLHPDTSSLLGWFVSTPSSAPVLQATSELHGITIISLRRISFKCKTLVWQKWQKCKCCGHTRHFPPTARQKTLWRSSYQFIPSQLI